MLRVVCCTVWGMRHRQTEDSLEAFLGTGGQHLFDGEEVRGPHVPVTLEYELIDPNDPLMYAQVIRRLWNECAESRDDLCLIEQDIEIGPTTLYDFRACQHLYCGNPYSWSTAVGVAMGCTRFRHQFIEHYRDAVHEAIALGGGHFRQFDVIFQRRVLAKRHGAQPHVHAPVIHHNEAKRLRADASPVPLEGVPADDIGELL